MAELIRDLTEDVALRHTCSPPTRPVLGGLHKLPDAKPGTMWRCYSCGVLWRAYVDRGPPSLFGFWWKRAGWWLRWRNRRTP